ncbi:hypothetical protein K439DRAFT_1642911 [Ramaria rubella]|nr:hypothetical protein K439DRAFT_1642911 [Ramaria rubella]
MPTSRRSYFYMRKPSLTHIRLLRDAPASLSVLGVNFMLCHSSRPTSCTPSTCASGPPPITLLIEGPQNYSASGASCWGS